MQPQEEDNCLYIGKAKNYDYVLDGEIFTF